MSGSTNLGIPLIADGQNSKERDISTAIDWLDKASNSSLTVSLASGNAATLVLDEFAQNRNFKCSGQTGTGTLNVPATSREFSVTNLDATYSITVDAGGTTVSVGAASAAIIQSIAGDLLITAAIGTTGTITYGTLPASAQNAPIALPFAGTPGDGQVFHIPLAQAYTLPANFVGSIGYAGTVATADAEFEVGYVRSGSYHSVGTLTFGTGDSDLTLSTQALVNLLATDILRITSPTPPDATLADCGITLMLKKV